MPIKIIIIIAEGNVSIPEAWQLVTLQKRLRRSTDDKGRKVPIYKLPLEMRYN